MQSIKRAFKYIMHDRMQFLDSCVKNTGFLFSDKIYLTLRYRCIVGDWINWKSPKRFTEKIQWLKLYDFKTEYVSLVDKIAVKEYVKKSIGMQYIIPTIGIWKNVAEIEWDKLPRRFVLKTSHSGGSCGVVICRDKNCLDIEWAKKKLQESMSFVVGEEFRERPYSLVERKIFAEEYIADSSENADLTDYKFFCFNGEPKYCQVIRNRNSKETIDFYDMEWNMMPFVGLNPNARNGDNPVPSPNNLKEILNICRKLSNGLKFARIDLYIVNDKVYFGEITLYPAGGMGRFTPEIWDYRLGELLKIAD